MMWFFGKSRDADIVGKVIALQSFATTRDSLSQLYGMLTILDTKATGLLTVDALFIAILSAFLVSGDAITRMMKLAVPSGVLEVQLFLGAASAFFCLLVVRVTWKFLGKVPNNPAAAADFDDELQRLANVVDDRTHYYWMAWALALSAFVLTLAWWSWCYFAVATVVIVAWSIGRG
jgi:hypothetical protein